MAEPLNDEEQGDPCPQCGKPTLYFGYGLCGGGIGPYSYCTACDYFDKTQDPEEE